MANEYFVNSADLTSVANAIRTKGETSEQLVFPSDFVTAIQAIKGGGDLNFEVVGNPKPSNPKENTIWIDTNTEITGWSFSADAPTGPVSGMVWIESGGNGEIEFNALSDNCISVYPTAAYQYNGSAWEDRDAQIYQNGNWNDITSIEWLYRNGDQYTELTGGWSITRESASGVDITLGDSISFVLGSLPEIGAFTLTANKIHFNKQHKYLKADAIMTRRHDSSRVLSIGLHNGTAGNYVANFVASATLSVLNSKQELSVPIRNISGDYNVLIIGNGVNAEISNIRLE